MNNRVLNKEEFSLFEKILKASQDGLLSSMKEFLSSTYGNDRIVATKDYIIAFGDSPVALVAHMDTVHTTVIKELFYDREQNVMWSPEGLGADDRAGVYAMVEIIRRGYRPTLILTTDEEKGGVGASILANDYQEAPCDLNFLIELDRRGEEDCVFYDCDNPEFEDYIEDFGFKSNWGSFSDISILAPAWKIAAVNLSIGYEDEHTKVERLYLNWMFNTIDKVSVILESVTPEDKFEYIESKSAFRNYTGGYDYMDDAYGYSSIFSDYKKDGELCWGCLGTFDSEMMICKNNQAYCGDCYPKYYSTCIECGKDYEDQHKVHLMCEECREEA